MRANWKRFSGALNWMGNVMLYLILTEVRSRTTPGTTKGDTLSTCTNLFTLNAQASSHEGSRTVVPCPRVDHCALTWKIDRKGKFYYGGLV